MTRIRTQLFIFTIGILVSGAVFSDVKANSEEANNSVLNEREAERQRLIEKIRESFENPKAKKGEHNGIPRWFKEIDSRIDRAIIESTWSELDAPKGNYSPILTIEISRDGSLDEVTIHKTSGIKVVDEAALKLIQTTAPFLPFDESIGEGTDIMVFSRVVHIQL